MAKRVFLLSVFIALFIGIGFFLRLANNKKEEVHYHAGFMVYIDGKKERFSDMRYMDIESCSEQPNNKNPQLEKAHLHDNIGDVVHVEEENAVWEDLFKNINYSFPDDKKVFAYVNNKDNIVNDILSYPIKPDDSIIIIIGKNDNNNLEFVSKEHIEEAGRNSESCG